MRAALPSWRLRAALPSRKSSTQAQIATVAKSYRSFANNIPSGMRRWESAGMPGGGIKAPTCHPRCWCDMVLYCVVMWSDCRRAWRVQAVPGCVGETGTVEGTRRGLRECRGGEGSSVLDGQSSCVLLCSPPGGKARRAPHAIRRSPPAHRRGKGAYLIPDPHLNGTNTGRCSGQPRPPAPSLPRSTRLPLRPPPPPTGRPVP